MLSISQSTLGQDKKREAFVHQVFFWLHQPELDLQEQLDAITALGKLEGVRDFSVGVPAQTPARDVVDHSYQISLTVYFDDLASHELYQKHLDFIEKNKSKWRKVLVYDFTQQQK
ncbi:MAG: Dabb family protein [Bacteroidetes bacterium]|nr:Dabb family protein [Bacteroidota bacterium]